MQNTENIKSKEECNVDDELILEIARETGPFYRDWGPEASCTTCAYVPVWRAWLPWDAACRPVSRCRRR